eukprot:1725015-Prymnesium_polylepis.1
MNVYQSRRKGVLCCSHLLTTSDTSGPTRPTDAPDPPHHPPGMGAHGNGVGRHGSARPQDVRKSSPRATSHVLGLSPWGGLTAGIAPFGLAWRFW